MKFYTILTFLLLIPLVSEYFKSRLAVYDTMSKLLQEKWKTARETRLLWKNEHWLNFNFSDPEYQRLWEIEIGAEDIYLLHLNHVCSGASISWHDYKYESEESQCEEC